MFPKAWVGPAPHERNRKVTIFGVILCRENVEFAEVEVEADSEEEAKEKALKIARSPRNNLHWESNEYNAKPPYVNEVL